MKTQANHSWWGRFAAIAAGLLFSFCTLPVSATFMPVAVSATGDGATVTVMPDQTTLVTFPTNGTLTVPGGATGRALFVGGGGGGGCGVGGGGGGGGVVVLDSLELAAGTYTVTVGGGGKGGPGQSTAATDGSDSTMEDAGGNAVSALLPALGGGRGGQWYVRAAGSRGTGGASCGGSAPGTGTPGQGYAGGTSGGRSSGGGGGAGGPGGNGSTLGSGTPKPASAVGGVGVTNDISGVAIAYGGGGGGGGGDSGACPGSPGTDGGGDGSDMNGPVGGGNGASGRGGGGGGSGWGTVRAGGNGGSGVVIVRLDPVPSGSDPTVRIVDATEGPQSAAIRAVLSSAGEDSETATVFYVTASSAAGLDAAAATNVVATDVRTDDTVSFSLNGLPGETPTYVRVFAKNDQDLYSAPVEISVVPFDADPAFAATTPFGHERTRAGADEIHSFLTNGTFTISARRRVRLLAVGGGGGAGWGSQGGGAGGGAGGMLEVSNVLFKVGTYRFEVGAGGAPGKSDGSKGGDGGATVLYYTDPDTGVETELFRAAGGGGSGCWNDRHGRAGGSGGGAVYRGGNEWGAGGAGTAGQGNAGGGWTTKPAATVGSSGGGGAGAPGQAGTAEGGGDGGDGLPSDITGSVVWYAGGGGASRRNAPSWSRVGKGGRGGGGDGTDVGQTTGNPSKDGADGFGGGGGGGLAWEWRSNTFVDCFGGRGGSGTLILRFAAAPQAAPALASASASMADRTVAVFSGTVEHTGDGAAAVDVVLTLDGVSETVATGLADGDAFSVEKTVARGASVAWSVKLVNGLAAESAAVSGTLAVPADAPAAIVATGASETRSVGPDTVAIFNNTASAGTLAVPAGGAWVEILLVVGGGAGGFAWDSMPAAGGGAGGFVHKPAVFLEEGSYTVTVGAGGAGREDGVKTTSFGAGNPGQPSILALGGTELLKAWGGGGGAGSYGSVKDTAGASSAGAMPRQTQSYSWLDQPAVEPSPAGQGHRGGRGVVATVANASGSDLRRFPGGGGGAGAPGGDGDGDAQTFGAGGDGLPCSITGEEVWYAGGGGCGAAYRAPGNRIASATPGGKGGGGFGQRWQAAIDPDNRGVNGLGGGGGSGGNNSGNSDNVSSAGPGHSGGSGTVIVRWRSVAADAVVVAPEAPVAGFRRASVSGVVTGVGADGATVTVELGACAAGSAETNWTTVATGLAKGASFAGAVEDLADDTVYDIAWRATSTAGGATGTGSAGSATTLSGAYLVPGATATGATITRVGTDAVYTYTNGASGTFTVETPGWARVLLAGGGGGCAGLRFGAGHGGRGGKGGGGEGRAWRNVSVFATEAANGADGLGGGGGGGSACRISSADASLQSYRGGRGGSGVVIVRMLTSTLETSDPVVQLRSADPTPGGMDLDFVVHSFGGGAAEAGLFFAWGANGTLSNTNDLGSVSAAGAVSRAVTGLKPGTTYSGALVATNAAGGATVVDLGSFRTATESHADADSGVVAGTWTVSPWLENDVSAFSDNLLRTANGGFANFNQNRYKNGEWGVAPGGSNRGGWERDLIDGVMNRTDGRYVGYGTNNLVVFTMAEPSALTSIRFFAGWGASDGWSPIAIEGIDVRSGANEEWTTLGNSAFQQAARTGTWGEYATLEAGGNDWLARDARQIRVRFDKNRLGNHDGTMYWEVEAQGAAETNAPALGSRAGRGRALAPTSTIRTATAVAAVVTAAAGAPAFDEVWAVWGPAHAGEDTNAWAHARLLGSAGEAATSLALSISGGELDDAVYLRYCGVGADGTVSWSDSVYVPELAVQADVPPVVVFGTASSAGASAVIEATVVSAGSLATVQAVDVTLQYTLDPTGFHEGGNYETFAFADDAAVGAIAPVTVSPLRAERRYYARFVSENDAGQVGTSDVFTFDTAAGGGGEARMGAPGLIQAKFTTGQEDRTSDIENAPANVQAVALGTVMANTTANATDVDGNTWSWGDYVNFGYVGYMRMEAGTTYTFGKQVDDWTYVKIDGTVLLDNNAWSSFMTCDYTATSTGWVPVEFRFGNGSGGAGVSSSARWGFAFNTQGNRDWGTFQAGNSPWQPVLDPGDGSLLRIGAVRSLAVSRAEATTASADVSATLSSGRPSDGAVVAVWGASDLGDSAAVSAWAGSATVQAVTSGDEVAIAATVPFDTVAYPILRLAFVPTDTSADTVWSAPVLLDAANPTIGPVTAATDGDRLTVSGSMASLGTGTGFSLTLVWGYTEDLAGAQTNAVPLAQDDTFSATVPVVPSTNGWWCLVARTTDGGCDATLPAPFATKGGSVLKGLASATVSHHDITATGTLDVLGAGTTTVTLWAGSDENSLEPVSGSAKVLSTAGSFSVTGTVPGDPHLVYWKLVSVNVAPGGTTWTSESPVYTITTEDAATYTWKAEKTEGDWDDPANWTVSGVRDANDVLGYPDNAKAKVRFVANTTAVIAVDRSFVFQDMSLKAAGLQLTFAGTNAAVCRLEGDIQNTDENNDWTNLSGVRIVVSGVELYDTANHMNWSTRVSADTTLRLENGAILSIGGNNGWVHHFGTNSWIEAVGGSRLVWRSLGDSTSAGFDLCGYGSGLVLEDSRMDVPYVIPQRYVTAEGEDQVIRLAGASAQLRVYAYFRTWSDTQDAMTNNVQVSYVVPVDGFDSIPLYADYAGSADNRKFAWRNPSAVNGGRIVFSVDKDSPLLKSGRRRNGIQLMQWRAGIDTKSVRLTDRPGVRMYYTYGFPQTRKEPTGEGEIPTGIAADIVGQGTTILVIQ